MALAVINQTPITIEANRKAAYSLILAESGGTTPSGPFTGVLIFPDGVPTNVAANAIATTGTDATGLFTNPVELIPGCVYAIASPNDGSWSVTRFIAPAIVGFKVTSGGSL